MAQYISYMQVDINIHSLYAEDTMHAFFSNELG